MRSEETFSSIQTKDLQFDLIIRTGEFRLSNFLLYMYAHLRFPAHWPDFGQDAFIEALKDYTHGTPFGKTEQPPLPHKITKNLYPYLSTILSEPDRGVVYLKEAGPDSEPLRHPHPVRNLHHPRWSDTPPTECPSRERGMHDTWVSFISKARTSTMVPSTGLRPFPTGSAHVHAVAHFRPFVTFTFLLREIIHLRTP